VKVRMLRSPGDAWECELTEGQTGTVREPLGERLVAAGLAVEVAEPKPVTAEPAKPAVKAVPDTPAIAEAKPAEIKADAAKKSAASKAKKPKQSPSKPRDTKPQSKESRS